MAAMGLSELAQKLEQLVSAEPKSSQELQGWYALAHEVEDSLVCEGGLGPTVPHLLWHFLSDADLRMKDSMYGSLQHKQISILINILRQGRMPDDHELSV